MRNQNTRLVYSTAQGRIKPDKKKTVARTPRDGVVRIRRETKGRKGKGVTTISGLPVDGEKLKELAKLLKKTCGSGGAIKANIIEIQGDHRQVIKTTLEKLGHQVKLAGG